MIDPALQPGEIGGGEREIRIELEGPFVELLRLFQLLEILHLRVEIVRLDEGEIGLAVLGRLARHLRLLGRRKLRLQFVRDFLREIGLDREDIRQIAVVIFRPDMLVVHGVDQLHVHPHSIPGLAHASFENRGDAERLVRFRARSSLCRDTA